MTSKTSSKKPTPSLSALATDLLTSHEYNDVTGTVTINAVDALMAIAHAITRLALVQETLIEQQARALAVQEETAAATTQRQQQMMAMFERAANDRPGHA